MELGEVDRAACHCRIAALPIEWLHGFSGFVGGSIPPRWGVLFSLLMHEVYWKNNGYPHNQASLVKLTIAAVWTLRRRIADVALLYDGNKLCVGLSSEDRIVGRQQSGTASGWLGIREDSGKSRGETKLPRMIAAMELALLMKIRRVRR